MTRTPVTPVEAGSRRKGSTGTGQTRGRWRAWLGRRIAPARFIGFVVLLPIGWIAASALPGVGNWAERTALAFDGAAACFLLSLIPLLFDSRVDEIRRHARDNDANRFLVLLLTLLVALVAMAAVGGELQPVRAGDTGAAIRLVVTLLLVWLFANTVYALHYAHAWYAQEKAGHDRGGIVFPRKPHPDYADFAYFAFTIGMTFQTSDVQIADSSVRRIALLHSFFAYLFNIGVIAFTINVLGGQ